MTGATHTTVLAVSRPLGSGGSFIAKSVAKRLGFHYVDRAILLQAAETLGLDDADLEELRLQMLGSPRQCGKGATQTPRLWPARAARLAKECLPHAVITEGVRFTRHHRNDGHAGSPVKGIIQLVRTFWERSLDGSWAPGPQIAEMRVPTGPHDGQCRFLGPCI